MKYLKLFESVLSEEDITDYLLELVDSGDIFFENIILEKYHSGVRYLTSYSLNEEYEDIESSEILIKYTNCLSNLNLICKRWNLDFRLHENTIKIYQRCSKELSDIIYILFPGHLGCDRVQTYFSNRILANQKIEIDVNMNIILSVVQLRTLKNNTDRKKNQKVIEFDLDKIGLDYELLPKYSENDHRRNEIRYKINLKNI